jgi:hypothetical protein
MTPADVDFLLNFVLTVYRRVCLWAPMARISSLQVGGYFIDG